MNSSEILHLSRDFLISYKDLYFNQIIPNFIKEIPQFAKCIYYLERNPSDKKLIFETNNLKMWLRSQDDIRNVIAILLEKEDYDKRIKIDFKEKDNLNEKVSIKQFKGKYFANILFSGGADSMCGAYHYAEKNKKKVIFTHTYHKSTPSKEMLKVYIIQKLKMKLFIVDGMFKKEANFRNLAGSERDSNMNLNQTRTFLYVCNAIPINYALGIKDIYITEQGPFTINPQFTEIVKFTNTTNPEFIYHFNQFLNSYFGEKNLIKVNLPFRNYTKAELMKHLPLKLLIKTDSCSKRSNERYSCFNCYACFVRRFSAYAYENYYDDNYDFKGEIIFRYPDVYEPFLFKQNKNYFEKHPEANLIIKLIKFCIDTLNRKNEPRYVQDYLDVCRKCTYYGDRYYHNYWDLLERFAYDILSGIHVFFEKFKNLKKNEFYMWSFFSGLKENLIFNGVIPKDFHKQTYTRILNRSKSIVGEPFP